jgi:protein tyrosine/serine phosphatase
MKIAQQSILVRALTLAMILSLVSLAGQSKTLLGWAAQPSASQAQREAHASRSRGPEPKTVVPKYGIVWQGKLTRSGVPKDDDGWKWLRGQGINTIINFRERNDVDYKKFGFDGSLWIPLQGGRKPTDSEVKSFLRWVQDPANQPVHIQCAQGKDRTGMMAALVRYAIEGWSIDEAIAEASLYRRGEPLSVDRIEWLQQWAALHPAGSYRRR